MTDPLRQLADAVLYEGYILWPYRRSAPKNQKRWTFGGVYPPGWSAEHPDDPQTLQTQCLLEAESDAEVEVRVRFLQVVERRVARRGADDLEYVDELHVGGERHLSWDEAVERETVLVVRTGGGTGRADIAFRGDSKEEPLGEEAVIVRSWEALAGTVEVATERLAERLYRVTARTANETRWAGDDREQALRCTFCSTHTVLRAPDGAFVSLTDPPEGLREVASACENRGAWPVLVGEEGDRRTLLSSPIILSDYPQIAPESPGDLFDATEIDQLLILNVLALTPEEQEEMRASDPRAREILERCASLTPEERMRLHGAIREFRPALRR